MKIIYYTPVGRLEARRRKDGPRCPVIVANQQNFSVDVQELALWSSLSGRICTYEQIGEYYSKIAPFIKSEQIAAKRAWQDCLQQLLERGLVVAGGGKTEDEALYNLVAPLFIVPMRHCRFLQLAGTAKRKILGNELSHIAATLFRKDRHTEREHQVMRLAKDVQLSTAEMVKCAALGICHIPNDDAVTDCLYNDEYTTSVNIVHQMRSQPLRNEVTRAVTELYLRRQIFLDDVQIPYLEYAEEQITIIDGDRDPLPE